MKFYNLTPPQQNIWLVESLNPNTDINIVYGVLTIKQSLNLDSVKKALNRVFQKNDAYRIIITQKDSKIVQYISEYEDEDIPVYFVEDNDNEKINQIIDSIALEHLSVLNHKLYDYRIIYTPNTTYICCKNHHLISDSWALGQIFVNDFVNFYNDIENHTISEEKPSYIKYIDKIEEYFSSNKYSNDEKFWKNYVENLEYKNQFEIVKDKKCTRFSREFDINLYSKIEEFCKNHKISEYAFFMGIISIYFSKIFSENNIVIGTPFLNRKKADKELDMFGMFVSTLPIKIDLGNNTSFIELCQNIASTTMSCFRHSNFPYEEIQKLYSTSCGNNTNLYEIAFSYQKNSLEGFLDKNIYTDTWLPNTHQSNPLLISYTNHFGEHKLYYDYLINIFNENDIENIHTRILKIIKQTLKKPNINIKSINILTENDINLLNSFNNTGTFTSKKENIVSLFEKVVEKNKSKIALKCGEQKITYSELNKLSNQVANNLIKNKIKKGTPISIIFDKNIKMFSAILGILKAGCYYIPILPEESQSRAEYIIKNSDSKLLICENKYSTQIEKNIIENQFIIDDLLNGNIENPDLKINSNDLSYIIYTSGSTGNPKGVMVKHENVLSVVYSLNKNADLKYLENDISISLLKYSFDASAIDIYSSLLNGGKLILVPKEFELNSKKVVEILETEKVTRTFSVSKWLEQIQGILENNKNIDLSSLRIFGSGGEVFKPEKFKYIFGKCPNLGIYNAYGPTETTMLVTIHKISKENIETNSTPIGNLIYGARAVVMSKNSTEILPTNSKGELVIFQDSLSIHNITAGYYNLDNMTQKRFIKFINPITNENVIGYRTGDLVKINQNLELEFLGREDDFIKINGGYLVSLSEIENRIQNILGQSIDATVISIPIRNINSIILYIVKNKDNLTIKLEDIKNEIDNKITFYMRPKKIIEIDKLPFTKNGKIDKKELENKAIQYFNTQTELIFPTNKIEQKIYNIIRKIVNFDFSITDDFENDLGLDSLNMSILHSELATEKLSIQDLYNYSNVKDLAYVLKEDILEHDTSENNDIINISNASNKFDLSQILITGCTGFVGSHILKEIAFNPNVTKIYCLVRQKLNLSSIERFNSRLKRYFDEKTCETIKNKVIILDGDLRKENLGLSQTLYSKTFKNVKTIINVAANVKHIGKYHTSYVDNVESVKNILKICREFKISLAHISTLSLNGYKTDNVKEIFTENTLNINQTFNKNPYLLSKYEAEKIILSNVENNNLNAKIFRIGNIMPRISDGVFQYNFSENGFLISLNEIEKLNIFPENAKKIEFFLTPVDDCAKCINKLLNSDYCNTIYHIEHSQKIKLSDLINILCKKGFNFSSVTTDNFYKKLKNDYSIGAEYLKTFFATQNNTYSKVLTENVLEKINFTWTKIDNDYLEKIINISLNLK